jgi:hypothetical protein
MKLYLFALALEFFVDWVPETAPVEHYPYATEIESRLEKKGFHLDTWKKNPEDIWIFWNLGNRIKVSDYDAMPKEKLVLFMWEPSTVQPEIHDPKVQARFGKIFTWDDDLVDHKRYFKFHYPVQRPRLEKIPSFEEKKFCTLIARRLTSKHPKQLYSERENTIRFFDDKPEEFDLYGHYWKKKHKNWRGIAGDKIEVLKGYKYSICYENTKDVKGYITEKIFDCFAAGVVPVYWGASNVTDYIPADCFIDRRQFKDNKQMYQFLKKLTKEEYEQYLARAAAFLKSDQAKLFTAENLVDTFMKIVD